MRKQVSNARPETRQAKVRNGGRADLAVHERKDLATTAGVRIQAGGVSDYCADGTGVASFGEVR